MKHTILLFLLLVMPAFARHPRFVWFPPYDPYWVPGPLIYIAPRQVEVIELPKRRSVPQVILKDCKDATVDKVVGQLCTDQDGHLVFIKTR